MERDASNGVEHLIAVPDSSLNELYELRHWPSLQFSQEAGRLWIKGLTLDQLHAIEVKTLTGLKVYEVNDPFLHERGHILPDIPKPRLKWRALESLLPVERPEYNFNYFGVEEELSIRLQRSTAGAPGSAHVVLLDHLEAYLSEAAAIRLKPLIWSIMGSKALLMGTPLLPIPGDVYWHNGALFLPEGYDLELPILRDEIRKKIAPDGNKHVFIHTDGRYWLASASGFTALSRSSFKRSFVNT